MMYRGLEGPRLATILRRENCLMCIVASAGRTPESRCIAGTAVMSCSFRILLNTFLEYMLRVLISILVRSREARLLKRTGAENTDSICREVDGGVLCPLAKPRLSRPKRDME